MKDLNYTVKVRRTVRLSDLPRNFADSAAGAKRKLPSVEDGKASSFPTRGDVLAAAGFCCAMLLLAILAASPIGILAESEGITAASNTLKSAIAANSNAAEFFGMDGTLAVNARPIEENAEDTVPDMDIRYIAAASAEEYIASPPVKEKELLGILPAAGYIISGFSYRDNPLYGKGESERYEFHSGIDIPVPSGSNVNAFCAGVVSETGESDSYGKYVVIDHGNGYTSSYAHLSRIIAEEGSAVKTGERIALSGSTGRVTGAHLHFELRKDGIPVDPEKYMVKQ